MIKILPPKSSLFLPFQILTILALLILPCVTYSQSVSLPTDRARVTVVNIPDAYNSNGPQLKVLRTDANTPLRAGTAWVWEKAGQEEGEPYFAKLRANGLNAVRMILFDVWEVEEYANNPGFVPTNWNDPVYRARQLARMERTVNYASANGMYVVINAHNKIPYYDATYCNALWSYVAPYFANRTHVLYEASNEPMSGIGKNGDMDEPTGALNSPRLQALKNTYNIIRSGAPNTHIMILTPPGINDHAYGTGLGNLAASFTSLPGAVDWTKTSVAYHLYNNDAAYGAATNAANLRNLHSRYPGWPSENAFPPGDFPTATGLDQWRSIPFDNDLWVNQTCERLGLGWSMWFINGHAQFDNNFPIMMADANAKGWNWVHDPLTIAPSASPAAGNITGPISVTLSSNTVGTIIRYTLDGSSPTPTLGTVYAAPIAVSATTIIKAIAYGNGIPTSSTSTFTYTFVVPVSTVRVNAGGPAAGSFSADSGFSTSSIQGAGATVSTTGVTNVAPAALYDTERWNTSAFTYISPVLTAGRSYIVRLHFAERYVGTVGARQFNIALNGASSGANYVSNFDVFAAAGNSMNKAVVRDFTQVPPASDGRITITFSNGAAQLPMINGVEILAELTPLETFRTSHTLPTNGTQDNATPAGDGVQNLFKYAFNMIGAGAGQTTSLTQPNSTILTPTGSTGLPLVKIEAGTGKLQLIYIRRKLPTNSGINYNVEFSNDLITWATNPAATVAATSLDSIIERVTVTDSTAASKRFVRIKIITN